MARIYGVDVITFLNAQMEALNKKLDGLALLNQALVLSNETCEGGHTLWEYQTILDPPRKLRK